MALSNKQRIFVNEYLKCWNATEAARRAGYAHPRQQGSRMLSHVDISAEIKQRLAENTMEANEVLSRLSDMARGNLADFAGVETPQDLENHPKGHVVKKLKKKIRKVKDEIEIIDTEIELNDPQSALDKLGKHYGLFTDRIEHSGPEGGPIQTQGISLSDEEKATKIMALLEKAQSKKNASN